MPPSLPASAEAALIAALLVAFGSSVPPSLRLILGLPVVLAGFVWVGVAIARTRREPAPVTTFRRIWFWLSATAALGFTYPVTDPYPLWFHAALLACPALMLVLIGIAAEGDARQRRRAVWAAVAATTVLAAVAPLAVPRPIIDVWSWTDACIRAMLHGIHPYTVQPADIYGGGANYGYRTTVFPYMPLTLLAQAPSVALLGDYRFTLTLGLPLTVILLRATGRRLALDGRIIDMVSLGAATYPSTVHFVVAGWSEPLLAVVLTAFVYFTVRDRGGSRGAIAFFMLPALKQYVVAPVLLYLAARPRPRAIAAGAGAAILTVAPLLLWNWRATLNGMLFVLRAGVASRADSESVVAFVAYWTGVYAPLWLGAVAQLAAGCLAFAFLPRAGLAGVLLGSAFAVFASLLLGPQAFINYYYFVVVALLAAALVLAAGKTVPV